MKLTINNLGKVGNATIAIDGITVIAGENGSGKSTISRMLAAIADAMVHIDEWGRQEHIRSLYEETARLLSKSGIRSRSYVVDHRNLDQLLTQSFWDSTDTVNNWIRKSFFRYSPEFSTNQDDLFPDSTVGHVIETAKHILSTPNEKYEGLVLHQFFKRAFGMQIGTLDNSETSSEITMDTGDGIARTLTFTNGQLNSFSNIKAGSASPAFYVDPLHLLDVVARPRGEFLFRYRIGMGGHFFGFDSGWGTVMDPDPSEELTLEAIQRQTSVNEELDKIAIELHGELQKDEREELQFFDSDFKSLVPIQNMASGAKTMSMLIRGLRNGRIPPDGLVIIDEPETNLHPEWQVRFAEFLVLLHARFSLKLLLNTHSPFFLKAIQTYSDRLDVRDACRYYKMERKGDAVLYSSRDVTDDSESVFADMSRPYAKLLYGDSYDGNPSR